jgi:hypothetical protein
MPEVPEAPFISKEQVARLAELYDTFYHCLDDQSSEADAAERQFYDELSKLWENVKAQYSSIGYEAFRQKIITEIRNYLRATNRLPSI